MSILLFVILSCTVATHAMEQLRPYVDSSLVMVKERKPKRKPTKYQLDKDSKVSPRDFTNPDLRRAALNIQKLQRVKRFLDTELKCEHKHYKDKITQFEQLTEYLTQLTLLVTEEGESIDADGKWLYQVRVQDRGTEAYCFSGNHFKKNQKNCYPKQQTMKKMKQKNLNSWRKH